MGMNAYRSLHRKNLVRTRAEGGGLVRSLVSDLVASFGSWGSGSCCLHPPGFYLILQASTSSHALSSSESGMSSSAVVCPILPAFPSPFAAGFPPFGAGIPPFPPSACVPPLAWILMLLLAGLSWLAPCSLLLMALPPCWLLWACVMIEESHIGRER